MASIPWVVLWALLAGLLVASLDQDDAAAPSCNSVDRSPQPMRSFRQQYRHVPDVKEFIMEEGPGKLRNHLNNYIPPRCKQSTRAALYNLRGFRALDPSIDMAASFEKDLRDINATVVALQDVPTQGDDSGRAQMGRILDSLGYKHRLEASDPTWTVMLASRVPIERASMEEVAGQWVAGRLGLGLGRGKEVLLINVRLRSATTDPGEATRGILAVREVPEVAEYRDTFYIYELDHVYRLLPTKARWPPYTSWLGLVLDEIVASRSLKRFICGAYTFHTATTGHLPQIVDLGDCRPIWQISLAWRLSLRVLAIPIVLACAICYCIYCYFRRRTPQQGRAEQVQRPQPHGRPLV